MTLSPTITPTAGIGISPIITIFPSPLPVMMAITSTFAAAFPGGLLDSNWNVGGYASLPPGAGLLLTITVPEGFTPQGAFSGTFDPLTNTLAFTPDQALGTISWLLDDTTYGPYTLSAELTYAGRRSAARS